MKTYPSNPFKKGQLFSISWGYEQTNNTFFQVVEVVGLSSCRVREVKPDVVSEKSISWGSRDVKYENTTQILVPIARSVFIKDQDKGDLKRASLLYNGIVSFQIGGHTATPYNGEELYESWYA